MRDPLRIEGVLNQIRQVWNQVPDLRLGQLLINAVKPETPCPEMWSVEDTRLQNLVAKMGAALGKPMRSGEETSGDSAYGEVIAEVGGPMDESSVALCLYGPTLDPDDVSEVIGVRPTACFAPGDRASARAGALPRKHGAWIREIRGAAPTGVDELLRELLEELPDSEEVWRDLNSRYDVQIRLAFHMTGWNRGFALPADLFANLFLINARIEFDIYAYGDDDDSQQS